VLGGSRGETKDLKGSPTGELMKGRRYCLYFSYGTTAQNSDHPANEGVDDIVDDGATASGYLRLVIGERHSTLASSGIVLLVLGTFGALAYRYRRPLLQVLRRQPWTAASPSPREQR
jgi:hypothetical protein